LIGNNFRLGDYAFSKKEIANLESKGLKIDINKEGEITRESFSIAETTDPYTTGDENSLIKWLLSKIKFDIIPATDVRNYIRMAVGDLSSKYTTSELFQLKFSLRDAIAKNIENHLNTYAKLLFDGLLAEKKLRLDLRQSYEISKTLEIYNPYPEKFQRNIFEKVGNLNTEEYKLAKTIDDLGNIKWWFRNLNKGGFFIQGYLPDALNPDFILETKTGITVALEYKGEHLADREYKEEIGNIWGSIDEKYKFMMITKSDIEERVKKIKEL